MRLGIIGAGHIGGNLARRGALAGHDVTVSFARDQRKLAALADEIGGSAVLPDEAAKADVIVLSTPWDMIDEALAMAGPLDGRIVIDTTNYFGDSLGVTQARFNADRMAGAAYTKCFNTLTAGFQARVAARTDADPVVQWIAGDDTAAMDVVAGLVRDTGYLPVVLGGIDACVVMESPRRPGAVYGEEYREEEARDVVASVRAHIDIPPTPVYP